ncbi:MAG: PRC-barrel domain-containing protein [Rhizobiales bacterium]|nr:PRC-barrel domain-containing protein [Hyphomicrobiales bacterium]
MSRKVVLATATVLAFTLAGQAQPTAPAPQPAPQTGPTVTPAPGVPAARAPAQQTTLSPSETTVTSMLGVTIYAPKQGTPAANAATTRPSGPTPAGATATPNAPARNTVILTLSEADWNALRENHDNIGDVDDIVLGNDGRALQIVLGVGGFLGIGEKAVAVDWTDINWLRDPTGKIFGIVYRTKLQLEAAPRFVDRNEAARLR